jgi:hypothetical protein
MVLFLLLVGGWFVITAIWGNNESGESIRRSERLTLAFLGVFLLLVDALLIRYR